MNLRNLLGVAGVFIIILAAIAIAGKTTPAPSDSATPTPTNAVVKIVSTTSPDFSIKLTAVSSVYVPAGVKKELSIDVTNAGSFPDNIVVYPVGPVWATVEKSNIHVSVGRTEKVVLTLNPPAKTATGDYIVRLKAYSSRNRDVFATYDVKVKVGGELESTVVAQPQTKQEGSLSGYATLVTGTSGAAIVAAVIFGALMVVYLKGKLPKGKSFETKIPHHEKPPAVVQTIVNEVLKEEKAIETYYTRATGAIFSNRLVPYEKQEGKLLWEV